MAKRGRKKKKTVFKYSKQLLGVLFIVVSVLGLFDLGPVGKFIHFGFTVLVGSVAFYILSFSLIVLGILLLIKGEDFDFFSIRMMGCYLLFLGLIIMFHKGFFIEQKGVMVTISNTMDHLTQTKEAIMNGTRITDYFYCGGGIIGGCLSSLFVLCFSKVGMYIVSCIFMLAGLFMIIGIDAFRNVRDAFADKFDEFEDKHEARKEEKEKKNLEEEERKEQELSRTQMIITGTKKNEEEKHEEVVAVKPKEVHVNENYQLPSMDLLNKLKEDNVDEKKQNEAITNNADLLISVLKDFGIKSLVKEVHVGPTVCQYELEIASGTRVNKITSINREIALALGKKDVRIEAPIPGKKTVGVEFANDQAVAVSFREIIDSNEMKSRFDEKLLVPLGKSIMGDIGTCRVDKMPHLLIAGTTGSGKSVCVNGIICSILMRARPDEVKLAMVDPKVVELSVYNGIPHLMCPVVNDPKQASILLKKMVQEMENRYHSFDETHTKNIESYNKYIEKYNNKHPNNKKSKMPFIVIIIDELSDLMMVAAKDVEDSILRITQKARAAGMHLIVATQRPSTEVVTGLIKANIPSRIAFAVGSGIDSRTILDMTGAEKLLGKGDMLFLPIGSNTPTRIQGSFIDDEEIKRITDFVKSQQEASYDEGLTNLSSTSVSGGGYSAEDLDELFDEVVELIVSTNKASASMIQRKFKVGYNRAGRIIDQLEEQGVIRKPEGSNNWEVVGRPQRTEPVKTEVTPLEEVFEDVNEEEDLTEEEVEEISKIEEDLDEEESSDDVVDVKVKERDVKVIADEEDDGSNLLDSVE